MRLYAGATTLLLTLLAPTGERKPDPPFDIQLPTPKLLVSGDRANLSNALELALDSQGRIWILDGRNKRVVLFDQNGKTVRTFGRQGDGPGEFRMPRKIAVNDTLVRVYDAMHVAVQDYRPDGTYLANHRVSSLFTLGSALSVDGYLVNSGNGFDSALATIYPLASSAPTRLGPLVVPPEGKEARDYLFRLSDAIKAAAKNGRIATQVRNMVTPVIGNRGTVWLLVQSDHEVRKYSLDGKLLWQQPLKVPEVDNALKEFVRRTAALKPNEPGMPPVTMDAAREIGRMLWILIHGEEGQPTVFYLLDTGTGKVRGRLSVSTNAPVRGFNIDPARKLMYLITPDDADIMSVNLASAKQLSWD